MDDDGNIDIAEELNLRTPDGIMGNVFDYDIVRATPGENLQNRPRQAVGVLIDLPGAESEAADADNAAEVPEVVNVANNAVVPLDQTDVNRQLLR